MANKKILLGLTTMTEGEWKDKVKEIDELELKEIALFPTCLDLEQRKELYSMLEKTKLERIPHVHIREEDFSLDEINYLIDKFGTEVFNLHARKDTLSFIKKISDFSKIFFVENTEMIQNNFEDIAKQIGGICIDFAHWEDYGHLRKTKGYETLNELVKKYKIGVNHISAIKKELTIFHERLTGEDFCLLNSHDLADLSELDYVKKYKNYLADIISIELENPLKRQLEVKKYLEEILDL